jgi:hypothetical protein
MAIDLLNSGLICNANMIWLYSDQLAILLVSFVDALVAVPLSSLK